MNIVLNLIVVVATVIGSAMAFPQARRIARTRHVDGVSAAWIGVSLAINGWWLAYGVAADIWALVPVSMISLLLYAVMARYYLLTVGRRGLGGLALGVFVLGMVPLPFLLLGGWTLAGIAVGLSYGVQLLPAVVATMRSSSLAGVSSTTWIIAGVEATLWLVYGIAVADVAVVLGGGVGVLMAGAILTRLAVTGHRPLAVLDPRRRVEIAAAS
jgi:uncharacterized protein with PQ loop repeat